MEEKTGSSSSGCSKRNDGSFWWSNPFFTQAAVPPKEKIKKLPGPQEIPELAGRHLIVAKKRDRSGGMASKSCGTQKPK